MDSPLELHEEIDRLAAIAEQNTQLAHALAPQELPVMYRRRFTFEEFEVTDDEGPYCLSYGVYNPVAARIYLALQGGSAQGAGNAFVVPPKAALILPRAVDEIRVGIDKVELGEKNTASIWILRYQTVQPFFLGRVE